MDSDLFVFEDAQTYIDVWIQITKNKQHHEVWQETYINKTFIIFILILASM